MDIKKVGYVIIVVVIILIAISFFRVSEAPIGDSAEVSVVPAEDILDVATALGDGWIQNQRATTTKDLETYVKEQTALTAEARSMILATQASTSFDPVTCQESIPDRIGTKIVYETAESAQVAIVPRGGIDSPRQAIVTLVMQDGGWVITEHDCINLAEVDDREFTFVQTGRLAQASMPARYDQTRWHLLFTEGESVRAVPLFFDAQSQCVREEVVTACDERSFTESQLGDVKGSMTETGVLVRQMTVQTLQ